MEEKPYRRHGKNTVEAISPVPVEQPVNPFSHTINFNNVDKIKIFVLSILALLPRAVGVILCLVVSWLLACIGLWGLSEKELREKPMVGWRRTLRAVISQIMVWLFYCSGFNKVRVRGRQATAREAPILALASHSTFYDALVVVFLGSPSIVAKDDVQKVPFFGTLINFTQPIYVVREDPDSRVNTIKEMVRRATSEDDWQQILIFPEGTCTNRKALITFKPGAFYPGVPVQPVCIKYPNRLDTLSWTWDGPGALKILWFTMTQFLTNAEIEFLPPYVPSEEEKKNPKLFADNVRKEMAKCLEVPVVDYSYEDCRLMMRAAKLGLPGEVGLVEAATLKTKFGIDQKELETTMLQRFAKIANRKEGVIRLEGFAAYLQIPVTNPCLHQVFRAYDQDSSGFLTFKKFVVGQMSISLPAITDDNLQTTFELLDRDSKGYIDFDDVTYAMEKSFAGSLGVLKPPLFGVSEETKISYDDFVATVNERPEYAKFFEIFKHSYAPAS